MCLNVMLIEKTFVLLLIVYYNGIILYTILVINGRCDFATHILFVLLIMHVSLLLNL